MSSLSTSDAFPVDSNAFTGFGCNESNFFGVITYVNTFAMEENVICVESQFPGAPFPVAQKNVITCNAAEKTVIFSAYDCYTNCSVCIDDKPRLENVQNLSVYENVTNETCFEPKLLPAYADVPYNNLTSFNNVMQSSQVFVENSCISTYVGSNSVVGNNTPSLQPTSSAEWVGLNVFWFYVVAATVGFAALLG